MKKTLFLLFVSLFVFQHVCAQMRWNSAYQSYIYQYKDLAIEQMLKYKIPASITLAQGLLESRAGLSDLATKGNNHFGIKCHGWTGRSMNQNDDAENECFRVYDDVRQSYEDHSKFLAFQPRYKRLFTYRLTDYKAWAYGLKACGYATSSSYAQSLINIIELYKLYNYDNSRSYDHFMAQVSGKKKGGIGRGRLHPIHIYNRNYYLVARKGDTFKSIGDEVNISWRKIAKYNERDKHDVLAEGDIVYLKKKQKRAEKQYKNRPHTVKAGESMYDIAQLYGIRLKSLYKKNHLPAYYVPKVGDELRVY